MGACDFWTVSKGKTADEAFSNAVGEARYEHGRGGYTGTVAEKRGFKMLSAPAGTDPAEYAAAVADAEEHGYGDKWGPALCVALGGGKYLFFGIASS